MGERVVQDGTFLASLDREVDDLTWLRRTFGSFFRDVRQADVRNRIAFRRANHAQHGTRRRVVGRLRAATDLTSIVPGDRGVNRGRVSIVDSVMHRADYGRAVGVLSELRQVLTHLVARQRSGNRRELATNGIRRVGLHIPHVEMTGSSVQKDEDAGIGCRSQLFPTVRLIRRDKICQRRTEGSERARLKHSTPGDFGQCRKHRSPQLYLKAS